MLFSWFRARASRRGRAASRPNPRRPQCFLERLEDRTVPSTVYTVDLAGDAGTADPSNSAKGDIRYCITQANLQINVGSTINFAPNLNGTTILLSSGIGELPIVQNMTIAATAGQNITISGDGMSRVFDVEAQTATVAISNLTITDGDAKPNPNNSGNQGGDIFNSGTLTLTGCVVSDGVASGNASGPDGRGGGIFNAGGAAPATLIVDGTTISGNKAEGAAGGGTGAGGGIYNDQNATLILRAAAS